MIDAQQVTWALRDLKAAIWESRQAIAEDGYVLDWRMKFLEGVCYSLRALADEIREDMEEAWSPVNPIAEALVEEGKNGLREG